MFGYVYKFTLIPTGLIYVGQHTSEVFDESYYGSGPNWKKEISKFNKSDIQREIICWCETEEELTEMEMYWIEKLDARNPEIGYNISSGGKNFFRGCQQSNKQKEAVSNSNKTRDNSESSKKTSKHHEGAKMMTNGIEQTWVYMNDIQTKLNGGWWIGSCKKRNRIYREPWNKGKHGVQKNCKSVPGYIRITNGIINTTVPPEKLQEYLDKGFWKGITRKKKN